MAEVVFSATVRDGIGTKATARAYFASIDSQTITDLATAFADWLIALDALTDGIIDSYKMTIVPSRSFIDGVGAPLKETFATGSMDACRVELTAVFGLSATGTDKRWSQDIPAFTTDALSGTRIVLADSGVTGLLGALTSDTATGHYTNDQGQALGAFLDVFLATRKQRRQLQRASFEV